MWSMLLTSFMPRRGGETYPYNTPRGDTVSLFI